jgi:Uma2 family endonuclease
MVATKLDFEQFALDHPEGRWELHRGELREKPPMAMGHDYSGIWLMYELINQLDRDEFVVNPGWSRVARATEGYYLPDLFVIPIARIDEFKGRKRALGVFRNPLPFVVEIWSPSTGKYDIDEKLPEYMARGDEEIWRLHPFDRTLTAWRRRPDGGYDEVVLTGGVVALHALPGVRIDLDALFAAAE